MAFSLKKTDREFYDGFRDAGANALRAARLLSEMLEAWPERSDELLREVVSAEHDGDRITQGLVHRLHGSSSPPFERADVFALAGRIDDVVDDIEEAADLLVLYKIEAPMTQAIELASVLESSCGELAAALERLEDTDSLSSHFTEIHRLENEGDRISRAAVASLFANGIDPMNVIRWKDIFAIVERAIDSTEAAAHIIEGVAIKSSRS